MLLAETIDRLKSLRLHGMAAALEDQLAQPAATELPFEDRIGLLVDREADARTSRAMQRRLKEAKLKQGNACVEDVDFQTPRGLDRGVVLSLANGHWITAHQTCLVVGATGAGKTYLACALGNKACRMGFTVAYLRASRLSEDLTLARATGSLGALRAKLAKADLLVLDDLVMTPLNVGEGQDLLEILEDRTGARSVLITSQIPVAQWHTRMGDPTIADAILDRLIHGAYRIELRGESMRKLRAAKGATEPATGRGAEPTASKA